MAIKKRLVACSSAIVLGLVAKFYPQELSTSRQGQEFIAKWEACISCTYTDIVGVKTNGLGATRGLDGKPFKEGQTLSDKEVAQLFVRDLKVNEKCVNDKLNGSKMPQQVFDMAVSLVHNNGCAGVTWNKRANRPTMFAQYMQAGQWASGCNRFMDFVNAGGKPSQGLINRRTEEKWICLSGYPR